MRLPDLVAYQAALQHPSTAFADPQLRAATVSTGHLGLPRAVAGNFAVTYQLRSGAQQWAVRCFHREAADRASRYAAISQSLARQRGGPLVPIEYAETGIRVGQAWYPITKMPWIDGHPLNRAVEALVSQPGALLDLEHRFVELVAELRRRGIAHGDLQHGNILVDHSGTLRLVDYDGMFVPALHGRAASESGDPNYQHPRRTTQFDTELDRFATIVIVVALRALAAAPRLWQTYNTGDNLLFRRTDFVDPSRSALFRELASLPTLRELSERLVKVCQDDYVNVPLLDDFLKSPVRLAPTGSPLKPGHVAVLNSLYGPPVRRPSPGTPRSWKLRRAVLQQAIAFSADGALVATIDRTGKISVRDSATGRTTRTSRAPQVAASLGSLAFGPSRGLIAAVADGASVTVWDPITLRPLCKLTGGGRRLGSVALSNDGRWVAAAGDDRMLRCWNANNGRLSAACAHSGPVSAVAVSSDGRRMASAGGRTEVHIWQLPGGRWVSSLPVKRVTCLAFAPDGSLLVIGTATGRVTVWDLATRQCIYELALLGGPLEAVSLSPDGQRLAAVSRDCSILVRRILTGARRQTATSEEPRLARAGSSMIASSYRLFDWLRRVALL